MQKRNIYSLTENLSEFEKLVRLLGEGKSGNPYSKKFFSEKFKKNYVSLLAEAKKNNCYKDQSYLIRKIFDNICFFYSVDNELTSFMLQEFIAAGDFEFDDYNFQWMFWELGRKEKHFYAFLDMLKIVDRVNIDVRNTYFWNKEKEKGCSFLDYLNRIASNLKSYQPEFVEKFFYEKFSSGQDDDWRFDKFKRTVLTSVIYDFSWLSEDKYNSFDLTSLVDNRSFDSIYFCNNDLLTLLITQYKFTGDENIYNESKNITLKKVIEKYLENDFELTDNFYAKPCHLLALVRNGYPLDKCKEDLLYLVHSKFMSSRMEEKDLLKEIQDFDSLANLLKENGMYDYADDTEYDCLTALLCHNENVEKLMKYYESILYLSRLVDEKNCNPFTLEILEETKYNNLLIHFLKSKGLTSETLIDCRREGKGYVKCFEALKIIPYYITKDFYDIIPKVHSEVIVDMNK